MKNKLVHHRQYPARRQAKEEITEYIEIFYNRQHKQARLGFLSHVAFTKQYFTNLIKMAQRFRLHCFANTSVLSE